MRSYVTREETKLTAEFSQELRAQLYQAESACGDLCEQLKKKSKQFKIQNYQFKIAITCDRTTEP